MTTAETFLIWGMICAACFIAGWAAGVVYLCAIKEWTGYTGKRLKIVEFSKTADGLPPLAETKIDVI